MKLGKFLNIKGALLDQYQLQNYLEKVASEHVLQKKSNKETYPIPRLDDNFNKITKTYDMLNSNLKLEIDIHPAGEWLLDNYYIIEEAYKTIKKELSLKKYKSFIGISNGEYRGFARIYVLASEIVAYTDGIIDGKRLKELLKAYQNKKTLNMEEIWNTSVFFNIALIEKIRNICEKIYFVQIQKYKVENIIERLVENKENQNYIYKNNKDNIKLSFSKEPFVEYLSYRLNQYGKKSLPYIQILEEQVEKTGTTISEIIKKEHFDIALKKLSIGNCIKSIKDIQRINFTEIFEEINGVEEVLKKDPYNIYKSMTHKTKEYYRNRIKEISKKTKISEIYIATKIVELANKNRDDKNEKKRHIGYYIIFDGINELKKELNIKKDINIEQKQNGKKYIFFVIFLTSITCLITSYSFLSITHNLFATILFLLFSYIPLSEIVIKIIQYILSKIIRPRFIPKIDFSNGISKENTTMVIMPTILKNKKDVDEMLEKLEVYYLANKSSNIYFTLLGDCTTSSREKEKYDEEIIEEGKKKIEYLNMKYPSKIDIFNFVYRKRLWNNKEENFLGWERKRGIISEFNNFLLNKGENTFIFNSLNEKRIAKIKYIITLDSDTNLVLDSAKELIGSMAHVLNKPVIDENRNIVVDGYGILQPRIGIDITSSRKTLFTKIYAGMGGIDAYSSATSDIYQDNFGEGSFIGKGIYDLETFNTVLENAIPNNTVLSHDLLEGIYIRCGLVTDIILLDSYPTKFSSYMARQSRWIRGDWQVIQWLRKKVKDKKGNIIDNPIGELGRFKIVDNLRRSLLEVTQLISLLILLFTFKSNITVVYLIIFLSIFIDLFIDVLNTVIFKKEGVKKQASFENKLPGLRLSIVRSIINFSVIIYKAIISIKSISVTLYRILKTKEHLLEWVTAEEAEKKCKDTLTFYIKEMKINIIVGIVLLILSIKIMNLWMFLISLLWILSPVICYSISKKIEEEQKLKQLNKEEIKEITCTAKSTWKYFEDFLKEENNFLPPDNYQDSRNDKIVNRTSSTNIGLALISIVSAYDLKFIELDKTIDLIQNIIDTIIKLPKWNGHLYNWYDINTLAPLKPEYISSVDSGNFIGYLITLESFLDKIEEKEIIEKYNLNKTIECIEELIKNTDFSKLYNEDIGLLSIGFNIEENRLTDSYYDLLASEARQASLIAIAKNDVPVKHWNNLSRTLTSLDGKKGLVSWSGTSFEYLMPNINIKKYKGSLLDESCKFMIMSQKKYCNKLQIPWGISEAAFNLKDLNSNYQYKAFGIPWLGLKRGLADDVVISSYGSVLAITEEPKDVMKNLRLIKKYNGYGKYGFYESIDFTPERLNNNKKYEVVRTYMAHHQALILLSINNLINNNILQKRFHENPQIKAIDILLQEKLPEDVIITKERKEKVEKIKYKGYDVFYVKEIDEFKNNLPELNVISNDKYMVCINKDGTGFSKYKDITVNRYKNTNEYKEGIFFYFKNTMTKEIFPSYFCKNQDKYKTIFTSDMTEQIIQNSNIEVKIKTIISPTDNVEIRNVKLKNLGKKDEILEVSSVLEPILSEVKQDYAHKAFNNLFLKYQLIENGILINRNKRGNNSEIFLASGFFINKGNLKNLEYEIDKEKLYGRLNNGIPNKIKNSEEFNCNIGLVVDPILSFRRTIEIPKDDIVELNLILSISENKQEAIENLDEYKSFENVKRAFEISKTRNEEAARYLQVTAKNTIVYQKILSYMIMLNPLRKLYLQKYLNNEFKQEDLWKYGISGDYPILLVKIEQVNDAYVIRDLLKAYKYFENKNVIINLVILNKEKNMHERYVKEAVEKEITDMNLSYLINSKIYILNYNEIENENVLEFKANLVIEAKNGNLENAILELEEEYMHKYANKNKLIKLEKELNTENYDIKKMNLIYSNEYGGFTKEGKEYKIIANNNVPSVWCNILSNPNFGTIVTQNLGGFSWYKNSRLNRISKWSNDTIFDTSSEDIFLNEGKKFWRLAEGNLLVIHGFGYSRYDQDKSELKQRLEVYVSMDNNIKINLLKLTNNTNNIKKVNIIYKVDVVLDEDEIKSNGNIKLSHIKEDNLIYSKNLYSSGIKNLSYIYSSEKIEGYTGNSDSIDLYNDWNLNLEDSLGSKPCMAIQVSIELKAFEEKELSFILGAEDNEKDFKLEYKDIEECKKEYNKTINYWSTLLEKIRVKTPDNNTNIMLNGWCMYQTIASRIFARSRFLSIRWCFWFQRPVARCYWTKIFKLRNDEKSDIKACETPIYRR